MHARPSIALDPRFFGRRRRRQPGTVLPSSTRIDGDLKLFALTFAAGFMFVSILIG